MIFAPLEGWRRVKVTARRTKVDFANCLRDLADTHFPDAEKITLVRDQLNTHGADCLCEAFAPEEAQRILGRFELHYTPKHGSWLDMAEIERSALFRQCLSRRIGSVEILEREVGAWGAERNESKAKVDWQLPPFRGQPSTEARNSHGLIFGTAQQLELRVPSEDQAYAVVHRTFPRPPPA